MNKNFYSFLLVVMTMLAAHTLYGQCTPVNCISSLPPYGGLCDTLLADAVVNQVYSDAESFHTTTNCFDAGLIDPGNAGTFIKINSVHDFTYAGLPAGITAATNQSTYTSPANGCFGVSGTPTQIGVFAVTANFLADITVTTSSCFNVLPQNNNPANYALRLTVLPNPSFSIPATNFVACDAAVTLTPTGTTGGTFSGPGVTGNSFNPTTAGAGTHTIMYVVSAQEGSAIAPASDTSTIAVTVTNFTLSNNTTAATCTSNNGSATVTVTGGSAPFTYAWSNSGNTATINNVTANTYFVTVTDAAGCSNIDTVMVSANNVNITGTTSSTDATCSTADGSATATASSGTGPYTYMWSQGGQTGQTASNLAAGNYTVTVIDANGCQGVLNATVNNPNSPTAAIQSSSNVSCNSGNNGMATVAPSGGTGPYSFLWNAAGQTSATASGLAAGVYNVTVTDALSCVGTTSVTITEPAVLAPTTNGAATSNVSCKSGSDGAAGITVNGGTGPYSYLWNTNAVTQNISGLAAGVYTATVTDANSCSAVLTVTITEPTILGANASGGNITCNGNSNGSATVAASGGTAPYTYSWSNSAATATITGLAAGTYSVTVTDANGCSMNSNPVNITEPTAIASGITATSPSTVGGSNGSVSISPSGGTTPYSYLWSNGANIQNLNNIAAGTYTVTITDANNCTFTVSATVQDPTSVSFTENGTKISVFPNPANTQTILSIESTIAFDANIQVTNVVGQVVHTIAANNIMNERYALDISEWAAGIYFVRIAVGEEIIVERLVKQ